MKTERFFVTLILPWLLILTGCAHPILISPKLSEIQSKTTENRKIKAAVSYYIPVSSSNLEVTTPGGGGDSVRYLPYRDIESGYDEVLRSVFQSVVKVTSSSLKRGDHDEVDYVVEPIILTNSGSTGLFTWPPTNFSVDITNKIWDKNHNLIDSPRVVGIGVAETGEKLTEHGIAGRRAVEDALRKMRDSLFDSKLNKPSSVDGMSSGVSGSGIATSVEDRLRKLLELKDKGLITPQKYEKKRAEILKGL